MLSLCLEFESQRKQKNIYLFFKNDKALNKAFSKVFF